VEEGVSLKWAGRHFSTDGKYDTNLSLNRYYAADRNPEALLYLDGRYDAVAREDNVALLIGFAPGSDRHLSLSAFGTLRCDRAGKTLNAELDRIDIDGSGIAWRLTAGYELTLLPVPDFPPGNPVALFALSPEKAKALVEEIQGNIAMLLSMSGLR